MNKADISSEKEREVLENCKEIGKFNGHYYI